MKSFVSFCPIRISPIRSSSRFADLLCLLSIALFSLSTGFNAAAQTSFEIRVDSPQRMWGTFRLIDGIFFYGMVDVEFGFQGDSVQIFRSTSRERLGEFQFTLPELGGFYPTGDPDDPGSIGWGFQAARNLSESELADLRAGLWWINVNPTPDGMSQLRGQITAVPEPSSIMLFGVGALGIWALQQQRRR